MQPATASATSSSAGWDSDVEFDLWLPTASPMTTFDLLQRVGTEAEDRGISKLWVGVENHTCTQVSQAGTVMARSGAIWRATWPQAVFTAGNEEAIAQRPLAGGACVPCQ